MAMPFITGFAEGLTKRKQAQTEEQAKMREIAYRTMLEKSLRGTPQALPPEQSAYYQALQERAQAGAQAERADIAAQAQEQLAAQEYGLLPPTEETLEKYKPIINLAKDLSPERQTKIKQLFEKQLGGSPQEVALQRFRDVVTKKISDLDAKGLTVSYSKGRLTIEPKKKTTGLDIDSLLAGPEGFELSDDPKVAQQELQFAIQSGLLDQAQAADLFDAKFNK